MKIETFALERWMTTWETQVDYDIAESGILPQTTNDLLDLLPAAARSATARLPVRWRSARRSRRPTATPGRRTS